MNGNVYSDYRINNTIQEQTDSTYNILTSGNNSSSSGESFNLPLNTNTTRQLESEEYNVDQYADLETYKIQQGDTLASIASSRGVTEEELRTINGLGDNEDVNVGDTIYVPMKEMSMGGNGGSGGAGESGGSPNSVSSGASGGGGSSGGRRNAANDDIENVEDMSSSETGETGSENNNEDYNNSINGNSRGEGSSGHTSISGATTDLRGLNLEELKEIVNEYKSVIKEKQNDSDKLEEEFNNILDAALDWYEENKDELDSMNGESLTTESIFDLYLKEHPGTYTYNSFEEFNSTITRIKNEVTELNNALNEAYNRMLILLREDKEKIQAELDTITSAALEWYKGIHGEEEVADTSEIVNEYLANNSDTVHMYNSYEEYQSAIEKLESEKDIVMSNIINPDGDYNLSDEEMLDFYRSMYTDEYIDALKIDDECKNMLKDAMKAGNQDSIILVASIINDIKILESIEEQIDIDTQKYDNINTSTFGRVSQAQAEEFMENLNSKTERKNFLKNELKQLKNQKQVLVQEIYQLKQQVNLMKYKDYFASVSDTDLNYDSEAYVKNFFEQNPGLLEELKNDSWFEQMKLEAPPGTSEEEMAICLLFNLYGNTSAMNRDPNTKDIAIGRPIKDHVIVDFDMLAVLDIYFKVFPPENDDIPIIGGVVENIECSAWKFLTDEEKAVYHKIFNAQGGAAAYEFLKAMEDTLNQKIGYEEAKKYYESVISKPGELSRYLAENWIGLKDGVRSHFDNVLDFFTGDDSYSPSEYASQYFLEMLANSFSVADLGVIDERKLLELKNKEIDLGDGKKEKYLSDEEYNILVEKSSTKTLNGYDILLVKGLITEEDYNYYNSIYNTEEFKNFLKTYGGEREKFLSNCFYSAGVSTGNMLPSILLSVALSPMGTAFTLGENAVTWGQVAANVSMFLSSAGGSMKEAKRQGYDALSAYTYGVLSGTSEVGIGFLIGRTPFVSRISKATESFIDGQGNMLVKAGLALLSDIGGEVTEEVTQIFVDGLIKTIVLDQNVELADLFKEIPQTVVSTIISTGVTNGVTTVLNIGSTYIRFSPTDATKLLLAKDSQSLLQAMIAAQTNNLDVLNEIINSNKLSDDDVAYIASKISDDNIRLKYLANIKDENVRNAIALTLTDENAIIEALKYVTDENKVYLLSKINFEDHLSSLNSNQILELLEYTDDATKAKYGYDRVSARLNTLQEFKAFYEEVYNGAHDEAKINRLAEIWEEWKSGYGENESNTQMLDFLSLGNKICENYSFFNRVDSFIDNFVNESFSIRPYDNGYSDNIEQYNRYLLYAYLGKFDRITDEAIREKLRAVSKELIFYVLPEEFTEYVANESNLNSLLEESIPLTEEERKRLGISDPNAVELRGVDLLEAKIASKIDLDTDVKIYRSTVNVNGVDVTISSVLSPNIKSTRAINFMYSGVIESLQVVDEELLRLVANKGMDITIFDDPNDNNYYVKRKNGEQGKAMEIAGYCTYDNHIMLSYYDTDLVVHEFGHALDHAVRINNTFWMDLAQQYADDLARLRTSGYNAEDYTGDYREFWADAFEAYHFNRERLNMIGYNPVTGKGVIVEAIEAEIARAKEIAEGGNVANDAIDDSFDGNSPIQASAAINDAETIDSNHNVLEDNLLDRTQQLYNLISTGATSDTNTISQLIEDINNLALRIGTDEAYEIADAINNEIVVDTDGVLVGDISQIEQLLSSLIENSFATQKKNMIDNIIEKFTNRRRLGNRLDINKIKELLSFLYEDNNITAQDAEMLLTRLNSFFTTKNIDKLNNLNNLITFLNSHNSNQINDVYSLLDDIIHDVYNNLLSGNNNIDIMSYLNNPSVSLNTSILTDSSIEYFTKVFNGTNDVDIQNFIDSGIASYFSNSDYISDLSLASFEKDILQNSINNYSGVSQSIVMGILKKISINAFNEVATNLGINPGSLGNLATHLFTITQTGSGGHFDTPILKYFLQAYGLSIDNGLLTGNNLNQDKTVIPFNQGIYSGIESFLNDYLLFSSEIATYDPNNRRNVFFYGMDGNRRMFCCRNGNNYYRLVVDTAPDGSIIPITMFPIPESEAIGF